MSPARPPRPEPGPVRIRLRVDDRTSGHTSLSVFIGRTPGALGRSGELVVRNDELEELIADGHLAMDAGPGIYLVPAGLLEDGPVVRALRAELEARS